MMVAMLESDIKKSCLIISYGPVPTPEYQTVEGGGMRAWGLAEGLKAHNIDVTVGVNASFPQNLSEHEGVRLITWSLDANFVQLINSFDAVIISYCMGDPSVFVAENIDDGVQLILDAYVPIYIEVSARESKDIDTEYVNYMADVSRHNMVLKRGDYFLYANDSQEMLYKGVLSALGVVNPSSYREKRLIKTPFGIHRTPVSATKNPYIDLGVNSNDFVVLWFGGIYPWFRIEEYLGAIKELSSDKSIKFVFVGGKNPFNPNPDFSRQYETAVAFAKKEKLTDSQIYFVDWVDFADRVNWFVHSDVIVSLNQPGEENKYSWRTRVMDYVWGGAVTITNGGDPLSEQLIAANAAVRLSDLSSAKLADAVRFLKNSPKELKKIGGNLSTLRAKYFWDIVTTEVAEIILAGSLPYNSEQSLRQQLPTISSSKSNALHDSSKLSRVAGLPFKVARKVKQKGVVRTAKIAGSIVKNQLKQNTSVSRKKQFIFISHPINNTGGPVVLLQMVEEYVKKYGASRVRVIAPGIEKEQAQFLKKIGITTEQAVFGIGFRFIRIQLNLHPDDFVLVNTAAVYDNYRDFILLWLKEKRLKHAYWFIHEDIAQLPFIHKEFLADANLKQMKHLVDSRSLSLLFPSKRTANEYKELLNVEEAQSINLHVEVDPKYQQEKTEHDFDSIEFLISGSAGDGRKGQILALNAFYAFVKNFEEKNPKDYRPFKLHLVAVDHEYIAQQIRWISDSLFADRVIVYESMPKTEALEITSRCNAVICCSLNETFGLYIAEGMLMGHVLLRNNSAGIDEQLVDGKNGFFIDHTDINQFASRIEAILNKKRTTNKDLVEMSKYSQKLINTYGSHTYISQIKALLEE